ncbi:hypothetical protein BKK49_03870 [Rodentibacter rarus]|uniref:Uncharacterized protein n=1 Tax=Rodentibacter rarus TaxID=1908260 RepID=A0A1V3IJU6_9PAST|nr:hypothetical protein [Rodentibacter rarus]OOF41666.1 hypothetical protein BKK50_08250 [Rodentibacter rarus]OOF41948.1 hypothetical protein BKK49_03870 [Rodentibacter rarus]
MIKDILIHQDNHGYLIILDNNVTIAINDKVIIGEGEPKPHIRIETGHPMGDVLCYYSLRAVISEEHSKALNNIGIQKF